jgi:probable phosphoglycerate mutase
VTGEPDQRIVLVRHGQTEWSANGRHTGLTDIPLDEAGLAQAAAVGTRLSEYQFALVLTSPLVRARTTAGLAGLDSQAELDSDLVEWDYGDYEGLTSVEIQADRPGWLLWQDGCPGGEQPGDVAARADRVIARCRDAGGDVALFAHGHLLRVLGARWIELHTASGGSLSLDTASVSVLGWEHAISAIRCWNDTSHLEARPSHPSGSSAFR